MKTKDTIKRNFDRSARHYDKYSAIQDRIATRLIAALGADEFAEIVDIGCGTGTYTRLLRQRFPYAKIKAIDISGEMIKLAEEKLSRERTEFITADAETAVFDQTFDLITSNACLQWFGDLEKAITGYRNALKENGTVSFSLFGPQTFQELARSLKKLYNYDTELSSNTFLDKNSIAQVLEKHFSRISVTSETINHTYDSLWQLLETIKYTGTRGSGINGRTLKKSQIDELEKLYNNDFSAIVATYQIFYCKAEKGN